MDRHLEITLFTIWSLATVHYSSATSLCFNCTARSKPEECTVFNQCPDTDRCFREVVMSEQGTALYNWGCASSLLCQLETNVSNRRKRLDVTKCFQCCDGNFCNFGPCFRDYCSELTCRNNGVCRNLPLKAVCDCPNGYTSELCETDINECASVPCQNDATCVDMVGQYRCICIPGFAGQNCQINVDECASSPCQNGATCVDDVNSFQCTCAPGFTGVLCEININECASGPCQLNGTCLDQVNQYICLCQPGTSGVNCEIDIDECQNVTCQNNGFCVDYINSYDCECTLGFGGDLCEIPLGRVCYSCENVADVNNCTKLELCPKDQECYMDHEISGAGQFNFNLGCVPSGVCQYIHSGHRRNIRPVQLCYECCDTNECNHHACADTRGISTTTPAITTLAPTTPPTTSVVTTRAPTVPASTPPSTTVAIPTLPAMVNSTAGGR